MDIDAPGSPNTPSRAKVLAAAVIEIRTQLAHYLGSESGADKSVRLAAHLAYALHNEAIDEIEESLDCKNSTHVSRVKQAEAMIGSIYADQHGVLKR